MERSLDIHWVLLSAVASNLFAHCRSLVLTGCGTHLNAENPSRGFEWLHVSCSVSMRPHSDLPLIPLTFGWTVGLKTFINSPNLGCRYVKTECVFFLVLFFPNVGSQNQAPWLPLPQLLHVCHMTAGMHAYTSIHKYRRSVAPCSLPLSPLALRVCFGAVGDGHTHTHTCTGFSRCPSRPAYLFTKTINLAWANYHQYTLC